MRIITGKYKGRSLKTVRDMSVRPVTDRVKSTIFNVLQNRLALAGTSILDLYAGSGSLGFESLSRGATKAVFVDNDETVLDLLEQNAIALGCLPECEIIQDDAAGYVERANRQFDLIFADPPYADGSIASLSAGIFRKELLKREGFLIIEHARRTTIPDGPGYHAVVRKEFGNTRIVFFTLTGT